MTVLRNYDGMAAELVATVFLSYYFGTWYAVPSMDPDWVPMGVMESARELVAGNAVVVLPGDVEAVQKATKRLLAGEVGL